MALLAEYLRQFADDDLRRAVRLLAGEPTGEPPMAIVKNEAMFEAMFGGPQAEAPSLSVGGATLREACRAATGWDSTVLGRCYQDVGDTGETIALLLFGRTRDQPLTLEMAEEIYTRLALARKTMDKVGILRDAFLSHRPAALKYFIKGITGNFRIGLQAKMVEDAVAAADLGRRNTQTAFPVPADDRLVSAQVDRGVIGVPLALFHHEFDAHE